MALIVIDWLHLILICRKFDVALDVGCGRGHIARHILEDTVGVLYQCDMAERVLVSKMEYCDYRWLSY